jgi:hypothetical protein
MMHIVHRWDHVLHLQASEQAGISIAPDSFRLQQL